MFLRTERLFLRPFWPEDRGELIALGASLTNAPDTVPAPAAAVERRCPNFLVTLPGANGTRIVGHVGLRRSGADADLDIWIAPEWRRRGFAVEAGRALLPLARALGHARVTATLLPGNREGASLLRKLGFSRTNASHRPESAAVTFAVELDEPCSGDDGKADDRNMPGMAA